MAEARLDAQLLMATVLGCARPDVIVRHNDLLDAEAAARFAELVARRVNREPISHITGQREFWSLPFRVTSDTLAPRPDSECLVAAVLARLQAAPPERILDLGTGTGCLLLALLFEFPGAWGLGIDRNPGAAAVAQDNARDLGLMDRSAFLIGDWADALQDRPLFDLVVSNPPYITRAELATLPPEVRIHEPALALDGGADGLDAYRTLLPMIARLLRPGGTVALEIGVGQAKDVCTLAEAAGFTHMEVHADLEGRERAIIALFPPSGSGENDALGSRDL